MPSLLAPERDRKILQVVDDPTLFAEVMLGHQVRSRQDEILQSVAMHARTAVKACVVPAGGLAFLRRFLLHVLPSGSTWQSSGGNR
jgi:hypothetical protein